MSRIVDEIETLVENTAHGRLHSFEPVRAKRRQLVRRRYTTAVGATLIVAAVVGYQLQDGDSGHKAAPVAHTPTAVTPSPHATNAAALQAGGLPHLAGTAWHIVSIGSNPGAYVTGAVATPDELYAEIRFSSDTDGILSIGGVTRTIHFTKGKGTVSYTEGTQSKLDVSDDVQAAEYALEDFRNTDLTPHLTDSGTQIALATSNGEVINLTRLDPVGPLGIPGDKAWSVRGITGPGGAVTIPSSLNARFRLDAAWEGQFAVGANNALVAVSVDAGRLQLSPFPFTDDPAKPGELAVTRAIEAFKGHLTASRNGRTLVLTSATGATLTLVSNG
jgi:hypothetical protein